MSRAVTFIGAECRHHPELIGERYVSNKKCVLCHREGAVRRRAAADKDVLKAKAKEYYEKNKDKVAAVNKAYREKNKDSIRETKRAYRKKNAERDRQIRADWRAKNCDKVKAYSYKWLDKNRDRVRKTTAKWGKENAAILRAHTATRRARQKQRTPAWANIEEIKLIYKNCPEGHHVDHIIPLQGKIVSGLHVANNLQYLSASENIRKLNKFDVDLYHEEQAMKWPEGTWSLIRG
jgi:hypothetical protein